MVPTTGMALGKDRLSTFSGAAWLALGFILLDCGKLRMVFWCRCRFLIEKHLIRSVTEVILLTQLLMLRHIDLNRQVRLLHVATDAPTFLTVRHMQAFLHPYHVTILLLRTFHELFLDILLY